MSTRAKVLIAGGIILFLYLRKKQKQKEEKKTEEQLKSNELSKVDSIEVIRYKLDEYLLFEFGQHMEADEVHNIVMALTSDLEDYELPDDDDYKDEDYKDEELSDD